MRRAAAILCLFLSACAGAGGGDVDSLVAQGRYDEAAWHLRVKAEKSPGDEALQKRWRDVATRAAAEHDTRAKGFVESGDLDRAEVEAETAAYHAPSNAEYRKRVTLIHILRRDIRSQIERASIAARKRDWVGARKVLEPIRVYNRAYPEIDRIWPEVARQNYAIAMREGERFLRLTDYDRSIRWYKDALSLAPGDKKAGAAVKQAQDRGKARIAGEEARMLIEKKAYGEAVAKGREAATLHAESGVARAVLKEALRLSAGDLLARADAAVARGDRRAAFGHLEAAVRLDVPQRGLRGKIASKHATVGKQLAAGYLAAGLAHEQAGRYGAAWALYEVARRIRPGFQGVEARRAEVRRMLQARRLYRVVVVPLRERVDATAAGSGARLAKAVERALAAKVPTRIKVYSPAEVRNRVLVDTGTAPDAVLSGNANRLWLTTEGPTRKRKQIRYVAGRVPELNNRVEQLKAELDGVQARMPALAKQAAQADRKMQEIQRIQSNPNARLTPQQSAQMFSDILIAQGQIAEYRDAQRYAERLLQDYTAEPPYVYVAKYATYSYDEAWVRVTASAEATFVLEDMVTGRDFRGPNMRASHVVEDRIVAAFPRAGIREDPVNVPTDAEMLDGAAGKLAAQFADALAPHITNHGRFPLERARKEMKNGNTAAELHYLALAWAARGTLSAKDHAEAGNRLQALTGIHPGTQAFDPARLPRLPSGK